MKNILVALVVCAFTVSAFACDGSGKSKGKKEKPQEEERIQTIR